MKLVHRAAALALAGAAAPAAGRPALPYRRSRPRPTPAIGRSTPSPPAKAASRRSTWTAASTSITVRSKDVQLTATLPLAFRIEPADGWRSGTGDVELGVKYRFFNDERSGLSAAIFPKRRASRPSSLLITRGQGFIAHLDGQGFRSEAPAYSAAVATM